MPKRRKGIEPLVAEMTMIVASLAAAVALNGFLFGTLAVYAHPAEVTASAVSCVSGVSGLVCSISLENLGASSADTGTTCALIGYTGSLSNGGSVPAGGIRSVTCTVAGHTLAAGSLVTGYLPLSNSAVIYFSSKV